MGPAYGDNGLFYFDRATTNAFLGNYGVMYWSDNPDQQIQKLGFFQALLQNLIALYTTLNTIKIGYPAPGAHVSRITDWANAFRFRKAGTWASVRTTTTTQEIKIQHPHRFMGCSAW